MSEVLHGYAQGDRVHALRRRHRAFNPAPRILFLSCRRVCLLHVGSIRLLVRRVANGHAHTDL